MKNYLSYRQLLFLTIVFPCCSTKNKDTKKETSNSRSTTKVTG